jgi:predicted aspartyl protease
MSIDLNSLNPDELVGKENESFRIGTKIVHNGLAITTKALIDTGANGFAFIDTRFAILIGRHFGLNTIRLETPCAVRGFDNRNESSVTHAIALNLLIDGRRQLNVPMLIVDLGKHDIIFG